jgi:hypothetical protein
MNVASCARPRAVARSENQHLIDARGDCIEGEAVAGQRSTA